MEAAHVSTRIGGIDLSAPEGDLCIGGAFELAQPLAREVRWSDGSWELHGQSGSSVLIARGPAGNSKTYVDAITEVVNNLERCLDVIAVSDRIHLTASEVNNQHFAWWPESRGLAIRRVSTSSMTFHASANATVQDSNGNVQTLARAAAPAWHESFRYYRLSQTTTDLFDAYRNAYLALESLLSSIYPTPMKPNGKPAQGEGEWFRNALRAVDAQYGLRQWAPPPILDPVEHLYQCFYAGTRSALSHAKSGRHVLLPLTATDRNDVLSSLHDVVSVYQGVSASHLGVRWPGAWLAPAAAAGMLAALHDGLEMFLSDDDTPFDKSEILPNPAGGAICPMGPSGDVQISAATGDAMRLWYVLPETIKPLLQVRRAVSAKNGKSMMIDVFPEALTVGSNVARIEVLMREGIRSSRLSKFGYAQ